MGVYGISTTLTKEGMNILKELLVTSSKETLTSSPSSSKSSAARETGSTFENDEDDALVDYEECTRGNGDCF